MRIMLSKTILSKKAQGLQISTVILAVLGILVLFILMGIVTGKIGWFGKGLQEATEQKCEPTGKKNSIATDCPKEVPNQAYGKFADVGFGEKCCVK